ncbi:hypothetical protein M8756_15525 [Lutimaribacter sp. EGI FJ00015]|nr:hypothetical protein [Lutimaribacter sp. EGI FJ00015]MCO0637400.1 hypothetical protein [Lutimaribacter sp. EGI FJ00014]
MSPPDDVGPPVDAEDRPTFVFGSLGAPAGGACRSGIGASPASDIRRCETSIPDD